VKTKSSLIQLALQLLQGARGMGLVEVLMVGGMMGGLALVGTKIMTDMGDRQRTSAMVDVRQRLYNYHYDISRIGMSRTNTINANSDLKNHVDNITVVATDTRRCMQLRDQATAPAGGNILLADTAAVGDGAPCAAGGKYFDEKGGTSCRGGPCGTSNARWHVYALWIAKPSNTYEVSIVVRQLNLPAGTTRLQDMSMESLAASAYGSDLWTLGVGNTIYRDASGGYFGMGTSSPDTRVEVIGDMMVSSSTTAPGDKLIVTGSGNVGIGTSTPARALDIQRASQLSQVGINNATYIDGSSGGISRLSHNAYVTAGGAWAIPNAGSKSSLLQLYQSGAFDVYGTRTAGAADWVQMIVATPRIATDDYSSDISLRGAVWMRDIVRGLDTGIVIYPYHTPGVAAGTAFVVQDMGSGTRRPLQIYSEGVTFVATAGHTCWITPWGGGGNSGIACSSDERLKTDVKDLESSLEKILRLRGISFLWKEQPKPGLYVDRVTTRGIGFIAQEVEKIVPELVSHDKSKDKFKSINYTNFVPLIVNAIHEFYQKWLDESQWLRAEILRLRSEFSSVKNSVESAQNSTNELRSSIEELRRENQALRRWVCAKDPSAEFCQ
jgi:hypothetical protein